MTPQEYVEENWETFNQGGGNSVEDMTRLIAAWDSSELRRQSQELERAREALRVFKRYGKHRGSCVQVTGKPCSCGFDDAATKAGALTQPAPEKP
jgi:hypothetical protein